MSKPTFEELLATAMPGLCIHRTHGEPTYVTRTIDGEPCDALSNEEIIEVMAARGDLLVGLEKQASPWVAISKPPNAGCRVLMSNLSKTVWIVKSYGPTDRFCATHWMPVPVLD